MLPRHSPRDIALSLLSREKLRRFEDEIGVDSGYRPYGYLFIARSEQAMAQLRTANELQHACGLPEARIIDADEVRRINPAVVDGAIAGGKLRQRRVVCLERRAVVA